MANVYVGDSKALVFPVMSSGYLKLPYTHVAVDDDNTTITTTDSTSPLWSYTDTFTIEAVITPYDVNGNGHRTTGNGTLDSTKTPPSPNLSLNDSNYQSGAYFSDRNTHKMMLFYNQYFKLYLQNTTTTNFNQPAEYKICVDFTDTSGSPITTPVSTDAVIKPVNTLYGYYDENGYYVGNTTSLTRFTATSTLQSGNILNVDSVADLDVGMEIFNSNGISLGVIQANGIDTTNNRITVADATNRTAELFYSQPREALYLDSVYKVSCVFLSGGFIVIYLDNQLLERKKIADPTFAFHGGDCFIGRDGTNNNTQFMGELFEITMHKGNKPCATINTLTPSSSNIIFYYGFGE